ncbi:MAG TPA: DUF1634 domain-containing protein [Terriglobia bacterium]|nr:DUF1634 domain-containing protein [Terriglobia bacterium]
MAEETQSPSDEKLDHVLGNLLIVGVVAAALVVLAGGVIFLLRHGIEAADYRRFRGVPHELRSLGGIIRETLSGRGGGLIQLGLLLLIATPVARVGLSLVAFARRRDALYTVFTVIVLGVLVFSLLGRYM